MAKQLVFVVVASNFLWGKGSTQIEAMKNARVRFNDKIATTVVLTDKPEKVQVNGMGGVHYSDGDQLFEITGKGKEYEELWQAFNNDSWEEFINDRIIELAANEIKERSKVYTDAHYKMYEKLDTYIAKEILHYD